MKNNIAEKKHVLHVGCGAKNIEKLPDIFKKDHWQEIRLDIDSRVQPDIIGDIKDMKDVETASMDAVFSSHNLEHLYAHEVPMALSEFYRVLKKDGFALITLPDIQEVAAAIAGGNLEGTLYQSPAGPISAIDMLWGFRPSIAQGNYYMAHKTGFTAETLGKKMQQAGFRKVKTERNGYNLWAAGHK